MSKRIVLMVLVILCLSLSDLYAKLYLELSGNYTDVGDADKQTGYGGGIGFDIMPGMIVYFQGKKSSAAEKKIPEDRDLEYSHLMFLGVIEKSFQLGGWPLFWTISGGIGYSKTEINSDSLSGLNPSDHIKDQGIAYAAWSGFKYHLTQRVTPYFNVGYHGNLYQNDLEKESLSGIQANIGVTFTFFGKNRELSADY